MKDYTYVIVFIDCMKFLKIFAAWHVVVLREASVIGDTGND
jgi:hypothetical protein